MKRMKKLLAIVLSLMIACTMGIGLSSAAFAAGTGTITINVPQTEQPTKFIRFLMQMVMVQLLVTSLFPEKLQPLLASV